jgi:hypothetical protein
MAEREAAIPDDRRIVLRTGVNLGDSILEDGDICGEGVNVAAGLEGLAEAGGICLAGSVYNQVKGKLDVNLVASGRHQVKNIAEPVETFRVELDGAAAAPAAPRPRAVAPQDFLRLGEDTNLPQSPSSFPVFLCYRRTDGAWHAEWSYNLLKGQLINLDPSSPAQIEPYYDVTAPAIADWRKYHLPSLQRAKALILVCTPGIATDLSKPGYDDWVYREIRWWLTNRRTAPIVIDATGDGDRWLPGPVKRRWPEINRLTLLQEEITTNDVDSSHALKERLRDRILEGIRQAGREIIFEDIDHLRRITRRLFLSLVVVVSSVIAASAIAVVAGYFFSVACDQSAQLHTQLDLSKQQVGEDLAYHAAAVLNKDPGLAFALSFEATSFSTGPFPNYMLHAALQHNPVWRRIVPPKTWEEQLFALVAVQPSGHDAIATDSDVTMLLTSAPTEKNANAGKDDNGILYLYDLERNILMSQQELQSTESFITSSPISSRYFTTKIQEDGKRMRRFFRLDRPALLGPVF